MSAGDGGVVYSVTVRIETPIYDTEVTDRVREAVTTLFPEADCTVTADAVVGEAHAMDTFAEQLREQEILDTARERFRDGLEGDTFTVRLHKQAAYAGVINFAVGEPGELGDVTVTVTVRQPDAQRYIEYVAPPTEEGVPIDEREQGPDRRGRDDTE